MSQSNYDIALIEQTGGPDNRTLRVVGHGVHWECASHHTHNIQIQTQCTHITNVKCVGEDERHTWVVMGGDCLESVNFEDISIRHARRNLHSITRNVLIILSYKPPNTCVHMIAQHTSTIIISTSLVVYLYLQSLKNHELSSMMQGPKIKYQEQSGIKQLWLWSTTRRWSCVYRR